MLPSIPCIPIPRNLWRYIRIGIREAKLSPHRWYRHSAIIVKGGAIIAVAHNHNTIHAEIAALHRTDPKALRGAAIWSLRVTPSGQDVAMARPCAKCMAALQSCGIRTVYFSTSSRTIRMLRIGVGDDRDALRSILGYVPMKSVT